MIFSSGKSMIFKHQAPRNLIACALPVLQNLKFTFFLFPFTYDAKASILAKAIKTVKRKFVQAPIRRTNVIH